MKEFIINTNKKYECIDITDNVQNIVKEMKIKEGNVLVFARHATAAIVINENADPNICDDLLNALDKLIPEGRWKHDRIDNNAASHIKAAILGCEKIIPVKDGKLMFGRWQALMLVELDGPRERKIIVSKS